MEKSKVYFTREITPESLVKIYKAHGVELKGRVGVKISTGEPGGHNYLHPELIGELVNSLSGTIIECCTAYNGRRAEPGEHWKAIAEHGFTAAFPCDIMDESGEMELPVENGFHLDKDIVGADFAKYDSVLVLSHFKGHAMGGMGGALKNISIGIASPAGKTYIHTAGASTVPAELFDKLPAQDPLPRFHYRHGRRSYVLRQREPHLRRFRTRADLFPLGKIFAPCRMHSLCECLQIYSSKQNRRFQGSARSLSPLHCL